MININGKEGTGSIEGTRPELLADLGVIVRLLLAETAILPSEILEAVLMGMGCDIEDEEDK